MPPAPPTPVDVTVVDDVTVDVADTLDVAVVPTVKAAPPLEPVVDVAVAPESKANWPFRSSAQFINATLKSNPKRVGN
jgi:hypothetical protein